MTNELAKREEYLDMPSMLEQAKVLIQSGFLPESIKQPAQAVAIMLTGRELNIPTMQALRQINVIKGKPTLPPELMLALAFQRIPGFRCQPIESNAQRATFEFQRPNQPPYRHTFTMDDATKLELSGKDNYKKQPATMLRWRCISAGLRIVAPDAIAGIYSAEEIDPNVQLDFQTGVVTSNEPEKIIEPPKELSQGNVSDDKISEAQRKRFYAIYKNAGRTDEEVKQHLKDEYGIESSKDISKEIYEDICKWAETK